MSQGILDGAKLRVSQPELIENKNLKLQGWLKKKSPAILKGWQKRFFMLIGNEACKLVYFDDDKTNSKPKGAFEIQDFIEIEQAGDDEFTVKFPGRDLELKAKSREDRKKWIETIELCKGFSKNLKRKQLSVDMNDYDISKGKGSTHKKVDLQTTQIVQMEKEKIENEKYQGNRDVQKKSILQTQKFDDQQILETLGFQQLKENSILKFRSIFGYLGKRSETKMKIYKQKWFILISAKPLFPEIYDDEVILQQQDFNLQLDTLIFINYKGSDKQIKTKDYIKLWNCKEIIIKNMQKSSDNGFIFKLNMGDKIYSLMATSENDRIKWQKALNESMKTCKEIKNKLNLNILKNINPIIRLYDMEQSLPIRRQKIKEKLQTDIQRIELEQNINEQNRYQNFQDLFCCLMLVGQDMVKSIEGCIVKDPQRQDIIQEYIEIYHEKISQNIREYWDVNNKYLSLNEIKQLTLWLLEYQQLVLNYIKDDRLKQGINTLLQIYLIRWKLQSEQKICAQFEQCKTIQAKNTTKTACVFELFDLIQDIEMIINENLKKYFKNKELIKTVKSVLWFYLEQLYDSIEEQNENKDFLIGVCNDSEIIQEIAHRIDSLAEQLQENKKQEKLKQKIMQKYQEVQQLVEQQIFNLTFNEFAQQFQVSFLDLNISSKVLELYEGNESLSKLNELSQKSIVEKLISSFYYYYFDSFLNQLDKMNSYKRKQIESKIIQDKQLIQGFVRRYNLSVSDIFDLMISLIKCEKDSEFINVVKGLKQQFGRCFTINTVKLIIENLRIRKSEVNPKSLEEFDQVLKLVDEEQDNGESTQDIKSQLMEFGQNYQEPLILQKQDSNSSRTSRTSMSKSKVNIEELISKSQPQLDQLEDLSITEGYIYKKKAKSQKLVSKWDHRYVRIRKGYIYWYVDEKSFKCQNKLNVQDIIEVVSMSSKENKFILRMKDGKEYEFKADRGEERSMWINGIMNEMKQQDNMQNNKIEAQSVQVNAMNVLIKNYDQEMIINNNNSNNRLNNNKNQNNNQKRKTTLIVEKNALELGQTSLKIKKTSNCWSYFLVCLGLSKS